MQSAIWWLFGAAAGFGGGVWWSRAQLQKAAREGETIYWKGQPIYVPAPRVPNQQPAVKAVASGYMDTRRLQGWGSYR